MEEVRQRIRAASEALSTLQTSSASKIEKLLKEALDAAEEDRVANEELEIIPEKRAKYDEVSILETDLDVSCSSKKEFGVSELSDGSCSNLSLFKVLDDQFYECPLCKDERTLATDIEGLLNHIFGCHAVNKQHQVIKCCYCSKIYGLQLKKYKNSEAMAKAHCFLNMMDHLINVHDAEQPLFIYSYKCSECNVRFFLPELWRNHELFKHDRLTQIVNVKNENGYAVIETKEQIRPSLEIQNEITREQEESFLLDHRKYLCFLCKNLSKTRKELLSHMYNCHIQRGVIQCNFCEYRDSLVGENGEIGCLINILVHKKTSHNVSYPEYINLHGCKFCEFSTPRKDLLDEHYKTACNRKPESQGGIVPIIDHVKYRKSDLIDDSGILYCFLCNPISDPKQSTEQFSCLNGLIEHISDTHLTCDRDKKKKRTSIACPKCPKGFPLILSLLKSRAIQHAALQCLHHMAKSPGHSALVPNFLVQFHCSLCSYTTVSHEYARYHIGTHEKNGEFYEKETKSNAIQDNIINRYRLDVLANFGPFNCLFCQKVLDSLQSLAEHVLQSHVVKKNFGKINSYLKCTSCEFASPLLKSYKNYHTISVKSALECILEHEVTKHYQPLPSWGQIYFCDECNTKFYRRAAFFSHLNNAHAIKVKLVSLAKEEGKSAVVTPVFENDKKSDEKKPKLHHTYHKTNEKKSFREDLESYNCFICSESDNFDSLAELLEHVRSKHCNTGSDDAILVCHICKRNFRSSKRLSARRSVETIYNSLIEHYVTKHQYEAPEYLIWLSCTKCEFRTSSLRQLKAHEKDHDEEFRCADCSKKFETLEEFRYHAEKENHNSKLCPYCSKTFSTVAFRMAHVQSQHEKKRNFKCDDCTATFFNKVDYEQHCFAKHKKQVSDKPIYNCEFCQYQTIQKYLMMKHIKIHENSSSSCTKCGTWFQNYSAMQKHYKRHHLRNRIYKCVECEFSSFDNGLVDNHMSSAHCNLKFKCRFCQFVARNPNHLRKHLNRYHVDLVQNDDLERLEYGTPVNQINEVAHQEDSGERADEVIVNLPTDGAPYQYMYVTAD